MATENTEKKPSQEELLKAVADVLDECISIYETEVGAGAPNDVKKAQMGIDDLIHMDSALNVKAKPQDQPGIGDASTAGIMAKEEDKKDKDKDKDKDVEKTDAELLDTYKSLVAKMETRGLLAKVEKTDVRPAIKKSEDPAHSFEAVKAEIEGELKKSIDERFESITKTLKDVAETVKKIASTPKERKGLAGYQPLKKNEGPAPLKKSDVINKLLELKKSGDARVDSVFITRVEQGRLMKGDDDKLRALGILGE